MPHSGANPSLLVVDQSATFRRAVREAGQRLGMSVIDTEYVADGLGIIVARRPSAVVVSNSSCELPGASLVAAVRCAPTVSATPIAILATPDADGAMPRIPGADAMIPRTDTLASSVTAFLEPLGLAGDAAAPRRLAGRILLVEDTEMIQRLLSRVLHAAGASVVLARDGVEAVVAAARDRFDLILMDIEMPRLDGPGALRAIREAGIRTPALAATAHGPQYADKARELGFVGVLDKQQRPADIVAACSAYA
jgi:CheY-like chemotaxis protein